MYCYIGQTLDKDSCFIFEQIKKAHKLFLFLLRGDYLPNEL